mmetsp:Transcript_22698/g.40147  ORF Transcript_22698/g.40147 Transcript_22698/m.40147 type:complete len:263 (+) Transcript_22698:83-871(+)|eukprot:CAMPEP_0197533750 /NCGR_PEP_ID=MMETSP1318-20131121/44571_1 /TAXON_ID=552666 /ORGANISM="Partenskyella glossopodia, Strain RCC365" /LENGTH=262 /DNA_ID=CAMNT_0043090755 /DNA_START=20 /DNA_END=808 /DNA_ORIENTATION=+
MAQECVCPAAALLGGKKILDCTQLINVSAFSFAERFGFLKACPFKQNMKTIEECVVLDGRKEGGCQKKAYAMPCDVGTHIDSPAHFFETDKKGAPARQVHEILPEELIAPGAVVDVTHKVEKNEDYELSKQDLLDFEAKFGEIPKKALVVMKTGWDKRWSDLKSFENKRNGVLHFPGFHISAAKFLIEERDIVGIGIDTPSLDHGPSTTFPTHKMILGNNKYQLENLKLAEVPAGLSCVFISSPLLIEGAPETETRVYALLK